MCLYIWYNIMRHDVLHTYQQKQKIYIYIYIHICVCICYIHMVVDLLFMVIGCVRNSDLLAVVLGRKALCQRQFILWVYSALVMPKSVWRATQDKAKQVTQNTERQNTEQGSTRNITFPYRVRFFNQTTHSCPSATLVTAMVVWWSMH